MKLFNRNSVGNEKSCEGRISPVVSTIEFCQCNEPSFSMLFSLQKLIPNHSVDILQFVVFPDRFDSILFHEQVN